MNAANENGRTPLDATRGRATWDYHTTPARANRVGRLLLERGAALNPWAAVSLGEVDWLRARHQQGVRWSGKDRRLDLEEVVYSRGRPLRQCAFFGRHAMAQILLEHGADPNILHDVAAGWPTGEKGSDEERVVLATMLLDAGARLDMRDDLLKSTPLGWACRWGRTDLVRLLLDRGADPIEADAEPWATPRAWAEKMNDCRQATSAVGRGG